MPEICCVLNCPHVSGQCQFRSFPKDPEKSLLWKRNIRQSNMVIKKQTRICDCHFESYMFWRSKENKRYLKYNAVPSIVRPKLKNTQVENVTPDKNVNKEETTFKLQLVQKGINLHGKRRYSGCCEEHDPGTKRQRTDTQFEIEGVPSAQKEVTRVPKRNQVESEGTPPAQKKVVRAPKRNQVESEGTPPTQKEVGKARKQSQFESVPTTLKVAAKSRKHSQIKNEGAPSAQNEVLKAPKHGQIETESPPSAQKKVARVPKNVHQEVPPLEKSEVAKSPDKEVPQETATGTNTTSKKIWCKLDDICRLCIKKCNRPTNVYNNDLAFKIQAISSIREMYPTDGLPVNVCQDCKDMTNIFYTFKLQCEAADETLRSCLKALQAEESNDTMVKQQTVAKPLFPELFKFSAFSSDDESDNEEVDSEVLEEEEESAIQAEPAVHTVPADQPVPTLKAVPVAEVVSPVKAVPVVQKIAVVQAATPSTSTLRTRDRSPPSRSLQDELNKAWTEFAHEQGSLLVTRKSTATARKENKPQSAESKNVVPKRKSVTKGVTSPKPAILISSASQKDLEQRKDEPQKESTHEICKPQVLERQNKPLQGKAELMKYLGNNVEVIQQNQLKGTAGNAMLKMVNNPKRAYNTKVDQHERDGVNLQQKISHVSIENKADKQNGSGDNVTTKATLLGSDSSFKVKRVSSEGSEMKKLGPAMSAFKVGALGQNVEIYRIPGQKTKPLITKPVAIENKNPTTSKTKDLTLQRTQIQERTTKIQESNGHLVQASKSENSPLCHIEIFKVQNHSDRKLCLTALEGTDVSVCPVAQVPSTKLVSLANKLEQNLQPVVKSGTKILAKNVSDSAASTEKLEKNLEKTNDVMEDNACDAGLDERLQGDAMMHVQDGGSSTSDEGKSEQKLVIKDADDDATGSTISSVEPVLTSDPKMHLQDVDDNATQSEFTSDAKVMHEENDINISSTEKLEENLQPDAKTHDDSTAMTGELGQTSRPVLTSNPKQSISPTSEKPVKTFPRPCKSISLPSPALTVATAKKVVGTVENLESKEHMDVTLNKIEDESKKNMEDQEQKQDGSVDMAKTVEAEKVSDIAQNIVEELLNGAAVFADTDSVGPEVPLTLGEPERKTNEVTDQLSDILESTHETELPQDISNLIKQTNKAVDSEKIESKEEADKLDDTTNKKESEAEELVTVEEASKLQDNSEECSQSISSEGVVVAATATDCDGKPADRKRELDRTDDERQCHICAKSFPVSAIQRHIASHWSQKDLLCEKCGISFFFPADLERHVISHGPQELAVNKEDCSPTKQQQQQHQQPPPPKASRVRTFTCGACGMDFTNWFQLRDHKLIHKKGKRHRCGSCSKHFRTKYLLQNHMWVHTMLKKPNCELCGKTFSLPWYVDRHIAEEHS